MAAKLCLDLGTIKLLFSCDETPLTLRAARKNDHIEAAIESQLIAQKDLDIQGNPGDFRTKDVQTVTSRKNMPKRKYFIE